MTYKFTAMEEGLVYNKYQFLFVLIVKIYENFATFYDYVTS